MDKPMPSRKQKGRRISFFFINNFRPGPFCYQPLPSRSDANRQKNLAKRVQWDGVRAHLLEFGREFRIAGHLSFYLVPRRYAGAVRREFSTTCKFYRRPRRQAAEPG